MTIWPRKNRMPLPSNSGRDENPERLRTVASSASEPISMLDLYKAYREIITHEDSLVHNRMTWLITIESFVIATFGFSFQKLLERGPDIASRAPKLLQEYRVFLVELCLVGLAVAIIFFRPLYLAGRALTVTHRHWDRIEHGKQSSLNLPRLTNGGIKGCKAKFEITCVVLPSIFFMIFWWGVGMVIIFPTIVLWLSSIMPEMLFG